MRSAARVYDMFIVIAPVFWSPALNSYSGLNDGFCVDLAKIVVWQTEKIHFRHFACPSSKQGSLKPPHR